MILLGDIGGTNCRLVLIKDKKRKFIALKVYKSSLFKNLYEVIENYLKEISNLIEEKIKIAVLAVAGPVFNKEAYLTNLNWKVSGEELKKKFNFKKVLLFNDLEALVGCIDFLKKEELILLKSGPTFKKFPKSFLALGTGLGEATLIKKRPLIILPTEAGHTFFPPLKEEEWDFLKFLEEKGEELSWEKVISGKALSLWYEFFYKEKKSPEEVTFLAKNGDSSSLKVVFKVLELIGRKISQTALSSLPWGGIYLAGGVILGIKNFLINKEGFSFFQKGFLENFKMNYLLERFPVYIITHPFPGLLGVLSILRNRL